MQSDTISLIIILFCIVMSAYFSATETAFSSLNRIRVKTMADKGDKRAALVMKLTGNYDVLLSTILIGNNIVNILSASLATVLFVNMLGEDIGASISTVVTTIVVLIFGEVSPKSLAKEAPEKFACFSAPFLNILVYILTPANFLFKQWKKLLSLIVRSSDDTAITEEELLTIVEEAEQGGGIDKEEGTMIKSVIEFGELEAADILTPRIDVVGIPLDMDKEAISKVFADTGYSRLPVYSENMDYVEGILYQKDFYNKIYNSKASINEIIRPVLYVTKNKNVYDLLKELQREKMHIAVVVDEFGGTVGIVTLEDILEEIVGEIWDEHDQVESEVEKVSDTEYLVSGKCSVEKLFTMLNKEAEFDVHTVNGWVMESLGKVPEEGVSFEKDGIFAQVVKMNGKRVETVKIRTEIIV